MCCNDILCCRKELDKKSRTTKILTTKDNKRQLNSEAREFIPR